MPDQGEPVPPESLSRGTQEQAYLAAPLPVIMDEVLVNFDPERAERTARAFAELADGKEGPAHQLLYFTCQPHMVDVLRAAAPGAALFTVENGGITAG